MGGKRKRARQLHKNTGNTAYQQSKVAQNKALQRVKAKKIKYKTAATRLLVEIGILEVDGITVKPEFADIGLTLKL